MLDNGKGYLYCFTNIIAALYHFHLVYFIVNLNYMYLETIIHTVFLHAKSVTVCHVDLAIASYGYLDTFLWRGATCHSTLHISQCVVRAKLGISLSNAVAGGSFAWREVFSLLCHSHRAVLAFSRYILNVTRDFAHQSREFAFWGSSSDTTLQRLRSLQFST